VANTRSFEFVGGGSAKFWEVTRDDREVVVRYGRIGTTGQTICKTLSTEETATAYVDKLIAESCVRDTSNQAPAQDSRRPPPLPRRSRRTEPTRRVGRSRRRSPPPRCLPSTRTPSLCRRRGTAASFPAEVLPVQRCASLTWPPAPRRWRCSTGSPGTSSRPFGTPGPSRRWPQPASNSWLEARPRWGRLRSPPP
jgi:predicted DNA-binding WGR domain protein